jgi:hypothetical protein
MEIEEDIEPDENMETPNQRYQRLHAIVQDINSNDLSRRPEWYDEHNHLVLMYQKYFDTFETIHPEITDNAFREKCKLLDILMLKLLKEYNTHRWFSLYDYLRFNQTIIWIVDFMADKVVEIMNYEEDSMCDMFTSMAV